MPYWDDGSGQSKKEYDAGGGYDHHGNQNITKTPINNNNPPPVNIHKGPTAAEIEAEKKRKRAQQYTDFYNKFKGDTKKKSKYLEGLLKNDPLLETYKAKGLLDWDNIKTYEDDINTLIENPNIQNKGDQLGDLLKLQSGAWGYTKPWSSTDDSLYIDDLKEFDPNWTPGWTGDSKQERLNKRIAEVIGHEARHQVLGEGEGVPWKWEGESMWAGDPYSDKVETNLADSGVWQNYQSKYDDNPLNFKDTHELVTTMGDFQSYNNPTIYDDIYDDIHGGMPRHLTSNVANELYDASVQAGKDFSARTVGEKYENIDPVIIEGYADQLIKDFPEDTEGLPRSEVVRFLKQEADQAGTKATMDVLKEDYEDEYEYAKGGVARKKYVSGGILDITGDEQITTDEGNDISLVDESETGVSTLFKEKNNDYAVQGGVKNYLGEQEMVSAPKYWQSAPDHPETELTYITKPEKDLLVKADLHGSLHGSVNRGPQGLASLNGWGDAEDDFGGWGNDPQGEFGGIDSGGWDPGVSSPVDTGAVTSDAGWDNSVTPNVTTVSDGDIWDWDDTSEADEVVDAKQDIVNRAIIFMRDKYPKSTNYATNPSLWTELKSIPTTPFGIAWAIGKDMYNTKELKDLMKEMEDAGLVGGPPGTNPTIYDEMWMHLENRKRKKDDEGTGGDGPEEIVPGAPVMEELQENEQMAWDPMSYLDKIRAKQAQRASLIQKDIIQDNQTMTLNSGGLANLFRVKNY